jgi:hypothetical protein
MRKVIPVLFSLALAVVPTLTATAQAKSGCKIVYYGAVGVCEPESSTPSTGGGGKR